MILASNNIKSLRDPNVNCSGRGLNNEGDTRGFFFFVVGGGI